MLESTIEPMLEVALKKSKAYRFSDQAKAHLFMRVCFKKSLEDVGVFAPKFKSEVERQLALQKLMTAARVKVEKNKQVLFGKWWSVLFVYKNGELVSFVTDPEMMKPPAMSTEKYSAYTVRTNVKL